MKKIATLEGIPRNAELKITNRASKLMNDVRLFDLRGVVMTDLLKWTSFISNNEAKANGSNASAETKKEDAIGGANGDKMDVDE